MFVLTFYLFLKHFLCIHVPTIIKLTIEQQVLGVKWRESARFLGYFSSLRALFIRTLYPRVVAAAGFEEVEKSVDNVDGLRTERLR